MNEPVAYIDVETRNLSWAKPTRWETPTVVKMDKVPLYTTPPKKEWVGFTQEEHQFAMRTDSSFFAGFLYAEKLLKEKNK